MSVTVIVGSQWGDEGKGKVTDVLTAEADVVARFQGGNNAGHTVVAEGHEFKLHLLPSGVVRPGVKNVIGNGVVVDPGALLEELDALEAQGITPDLVVSDRAHVITPYHRLLDGAREAARGEGNAIGTTKRGIGPTYADKAARVGVRVGDLLDEARLRARLAAALPAKVRELDALGVDHDLELDTLVESLRSHGKRLEGRVADTVAILGDAVDAGQSVLLEGAQGTFLDIDHGTYPFVTSSNTTAGGACPGSGVPPTRITDVVGVVKAYTTRVGAGPFVTELDYDESAVGRHLTEEGHEFGTTTGRRRRVGWLDLPLLRRAARVNGFTAYALTKLDVLEGLDALQVCVAYEADGERYEEPPGGPDVLARCAPVYEELDGFEKAVTGDVSEGLGALAPAARAYVDRVSEAVGCAPMLVSFGPAREETLLNR